MTRVPNTISELSVAMSSRIESYLAWAATAVCKHTHALPSDSTHENNQWKVRLKELTSKSNDRYEIQANTIKRPKLQESLRKRSFPQCYLQSPQNHISMDDSVVPNSLDDEHALESPWIRVIEFLLLLVVVQSLIQSQIAVDSRALIN